MPEKNDFLKNVQAAQFVRDSNDQLKRNLSGIMGNTTKAFAVSTQVQTQSLHTLKNIDSSINLLSKQLLENQKSITTLQKSTKDFLKDTVIKKSDNQNQTRQFFKQADPDASMRTNIQDIENLLAESLEEQKKARKKKGSLLKTLGGLLAIGGLAGYLLTGKKEFLFSVVKGIGKYFTKGLLGLFKVGKLGGKFKKMFGGISKIGKVFGNVIKSISGFKIGTIPKFIKGIPTFFKGIGNVIKSIGKIFTKGGMKGVMTGASKGLSKGLGVASKSVLKKIPVVGGLLGLMFGIARFKKGQWKEGLLEVASGIASIVPGIGTALSIGIDAFLLMKDFKGIETGAGSANAEFATGAKKLGKQVLRNLPVIGTFIRIKEGFDLWKSGNKIGALKAIGGGISSIIPMGGMAFDFIDNLAGTISEKGFVGGIKSLFGGDSGDKGGDSGDKGGDRIITSTVAGKRVYGKVPFKFTGKESSDPKEYDKNFTPKKVGFFERILRAMKPYKGIRLFEKWQPDITGLQPDMFKNFTNMADEYYAMTGDTVQVNSAKRSGSGRSVHDYGWAVDIQSTDANVLANLGLLEKYGFHRPLLNWGKYSGGKNEPWHLEPYPGEKIYGARDTINNDFRIGTLMGKKGVTPEQGGGGFNLPQGTVEDVIDANKPTEVLLTDRDIARLAEAFGEQMKINKPEVNKTSSTIPMSNPRGAF